MAAHPHSNLSVVLPGARGDPGMKARGWGGSSYIRTRRLRRPEPHKYHLKAGVCDGQNNVKFGPFGILQTLSHPG
jgi:hypothetical protein